VKILDALAEDGHTVESVFGVAEDARRLAAAVADVEIPETSSCRSLGCRLRAWVTRNRFPNWS
jgi:hypothetical protein